MSKRLTRITTRTGDDGTTGLCGGERVSKDHPRIEAMGAVDELNSTIGLLLSEKLEDERRKLLLRIQHHLFDLGGELSMPGESFFKPEHVSYLEDQGKALNQALPALEEFILPGGSRASALCHVARTVTRRAERRVLSLHHVEAVPEASRLYLNRLSDLLFDLARTLNVDDDTDEVFWKNENA